MAKRVDVLCGCGWGRLSIRESEVPECCPVCGFNFLEWAGNQPCKYDEEPEDDRGQTTLAI
jgi:hypothetical protein